MGQRRYRFYFRRMGDARPCDPGRSAQRCDLQVIWVPAADHDNAELQEMLDAVSARRPQVNPITLASRSASELRKHELSDLTMVNAILVEPMEFADQLIRVGRCTVVVQGTSVRLAFASNDTNLAMTPA